MKSSRSFARARWGALAIGSWMVLAGSSTAVAVVLSEQEIDVIPISLNFGSTQIGSSTSGSFAVINAGQQDLVVSGIELTAGADFSLEFGVAAQDCTTSTPVIGGFGDRCAVRVRFTPTAVGVSTGEVTISSNDTDEPIVTVSLQGTGIEPPAPEIHVDPVYIDFMAVAVGSSATREITISNTGPDPLLLGPGILSNWVDFAVDDYGGSAPCGLAGFVPTDGSCTITVTFSPTTPDPVAALLTLSSNDQSDPTVDVALFGNRTEVVEDCFNGIDDDGDEFVDCVDRDCFDEIRCGAHPCWDVEIVDQGDQCVDVAVSEDGDVHLVYFAAASGGSGSILRHAVSNPDDAPDWAFDDVDVAAGPGGDCAVTLGADGDAHLAYVADGELRYATDASGDWALWTVAEDVDANTSIALDSSGLPHLSFRAIQDGKFSPFYARQLAPGGDFETYNPEFRWFADGSGGVTPFIDRGWYAEVSRIALDTSDYPLVLFSDSLPESSALGRVPNWAEGIAELDVDLFGLPVDLALGMDDRIHTAGVVIERMLADGGTETVNQLWYATHPGGAFPASADWTYHAVETVHSPRNGPADAVSGSLALDSEGNAHFAYEDTTRFERGSLKYLKVVLDGDTVSSQVTEEVNFLYGSWGGVGRSAEIALDASGEAHIGYLGDLTEPIEVRYARRVTCPGPMLSVSPSRSVFYELPQTETFYITNVGVGDLEISSMRFNSAYNASAGDWAFVDCTEDHPFDFFEGDVSEQASADFDPPVVLAEGEFGVVCAAFDPEFIKHGMAIDLLVESSAGIGRASLSAGGEAEPSGDGCDNCDGCAMSSPDGGLDFQTLLGLSMFGCAVLLWRAVRLRG